MPGNAYAAMASAIASATRSARSLSRERKRRRRPDDGAGGASPFVAPSVVGRTAAYFARPPDRRRERCCCNRPNSAVRLPLTAPPARRSHCRRAIVPTAASRRCLCHESARERQSGLTIAFAWKHALDPTAPALRSPRRARTVTRARVLRRKASVRISAAPSSPSLPLSPRSTRRAPRRETIAFIAGPPRSALALIGDQTQLRDDPLLAADEQAESRWPDGVRCASWPEQEQADAARLIAKGWSRQSRPIQPSGFQQVVTTETTGSNYVSNGKLPWGQMDDPPAA